MTKQRKKLLIVAIAALVASLIAIPMLGHFRAGQDRKAALPVMTFQGIQSQLTALEGDDLSAAALEGVTATDEEGNDYPVEVTVCGPGGEEISDCPPGTYRLLYTCRAEETLLASAESVLVVEEVDREPPSILGVRDSTAVAGETISYRAGVTVTDNRDPDVRLQVDASQVDMNTPGEYPVTYSAVDSSGNRASVTVTITVEAAETAKETETAARAAQAQPVVITQELVEAKADAILARIVNDGMTRREKARAIFDYVHRHIKYVGASDKSSWVVGAYNGFTAGRGDCYNYFACSKALLTRAGIPNVDLRRVGGSTNHYWQLVNVGDGWYHFDACYRPTSYPLNGFLLTENQARAYTQLVSPVRANYYVYDYASCPVEVVMGPKITMVQQEPGAVPIEVPVAEEPPVEPELSAVPELPTEPQFPAEAEAPAETETPAESGTPAEAETPMESETPAETETPTESAALPELPPEAYDVSMPSSEEPPDTELPAPES